MTAMTTDLPTWDQMSDLDKGAALLHLRKRHTDGPRYATEHYPCHYFDHPALLALDEEDASAHAAGLKYQGGTFRALGADEYQRLYDLALDADRKRGVA